MSVTVTIHHGELKQIKRLIEEKKTKTVKGQLYGLWTHSYQPVIQYVTGDLNPNESKEVKEHLEVYHGLKHVGNWSTRVDGDGDKSDPESPPFLEMTVKLSPDKNAMEVIKLCVYRREKSSGNKNKQNGVIEKLEGDSAFRLNHGPFGMSKLSSYHNKAISGPLEVITPSPGAGNEAETRKEQWYATEKGMQMFGKIHGTLQECGFEIIGTSRDTKTHDISLTLGLGQKEYSVDFPLNFPQEMAVLTLHGRRKEQIRLAEAKSEEKGKSKKKDLQPSTQRNISKKNQQEKASQEEVAPMEGDDEDTDESTEGRPSQQHLDPEKVPGLLAQGILAQIEDIGTRV